MGGSPSSCHLPVLGPHICRPCLPSRGPGSTHPPTRACCTHGGESLALLKPHSHLLTGESFGSTVCTPARQGRWRVHRGACVRVRVHLWPPPSCALSKHFCVSLLLPSSSAPLGFSLCLFLSGCLFVLFWASFHLGVFLLTVLSSPFSCWLSPTRP